MKYKLIHEKKMKMTGMQHYNDSSIFIMLYSSDTFNHNNVCMSVTERRIRTCAFRLANAQTRDRVHENLPLIRVLNRARSKRG